jgi:hypothetical protein
MYSSVMEGFMTPSMTVVGFYVFSFRLGGFSNPQNTYNGKNGKEVVGPYFWEGPFEQCAHVVQKILIGLSSKGTGKQRRKERT